MDIEQLNKALAEEKREPIRKLARAIFKQQPPTEMQSLIFSKDKFKTGAAATKWALDHEFKADKVDETQSSFRLRQRDPDDFVSTSFRTIEIDDGVSAVIGRLRPELRGTTEKAKACPPAKKRERTREYLERALKLAKEMLPGWAYATLMRTARGYAGGKVRARLRAEEKLLLQKSAGSLTDVELQKAHARFKELLQDAVRKGQSELSEALTKMQVLVEEELDKRGDPLATEDVPTPETAIAMMAKNNDVVPSFEVVGEVIDASDEPAVVRFGEEHDVYPAAMDGLEPEQGDLVNVFYEDGGFTIKSFATTTVPTDGERVEGLLATAEQIQKVSPLDFVGPEVAKVVFVAHQPSGLEMARREALVGPDGAKFMESYLEPLGLSKADVAVGFAVPSIAGKDLDWSARLDAQLSRWPEAPLVALGKDARRLLGSRVEVAVPHPGAIRKRGDRGEVGRKLKALRKRLDKKGPIVEYVGTVGSAPIPKESTDRTLADLTGGLRGFGDGLRVRVSKSIDDKQIVYGVVLDPYVVDLQGDWIPPADIEATAHDFVEKSRVIGFEHFTKADATLVESSIEPYPTPEDYQAAMQNLPHKVSRRKFGSDVVNSGAWLAGVKLSDGLWDMHKQGKLNAFSIGGFSFKTKVTTSAMPEVEFVELLESR
jgi:hypothetical protein